jgi:hypothetical protein
MAVNGLSRREMLQFFQLHCLNQMKTMRMLDVSLVQLGDIYQLIPVTLVELLYISMLEILVALAARLMIVIFYGSLNLRISGI